MAIWILVKLKHKGMKQKIFISVVLLSLLLMSFCCKDVFKDEEFTLIKAPYTGKEFKINGYYYNYYYDTARVRVFVFYNNSCVIKGFIRYTKDEFENMFRNGEFKNSIKENSSCWGLFNIDSNNIKIEHYYPMEGDLKNRVYINSGIIINDTTFIITKFMRPDGSELSTKNDTFHFKQFSSKPDSTNNFIK